MNKRTLHRMFSVLMALVMAVSLLTGCGTKSAEQVQEQEDAQTIQVYLWTTSLYENYAPYIQAQLPDVNIEFIVGNNDLDFYKFLNENGGLPDIITCCRFSLHDAVPLPTDYASFVAACQASKIKHPQQAPQSFWTSGEQLAVGAFRCLFQYVCKDLQQVRNIQRLCNVAVHPGFQCILTVFFKGICRHCKDGDASLCSIRQGTDLPRCLVAVHPGHLDVH